MIISSRPKAQAKIRRVFYVDVGNMPADQVKKYLEDIKKQLQGPSKDVNTITV